MLEWLGDLNNSNLLLEAAKRIRNVVENLYAEKRILTSDLGGSAKTSEVTAAICKALA
jgi:isocitrate/isopropylmalate dehydrogenase